MTPRTSVVESVDTDVDQVLLADGTPAIVRRLTASDRPAVTELFDSCSEANLYTRFFTLGHSMVARHVDHLCDKTSNAVSYVAELGERIIGVADVEPCEPGTSEIAFLVADDMHGLGVATLILERAARDAWAAGTEWFVADVLAVNHPMLEVFSDAGYRVERHLARSEVSLRMSTECTPAVRAATAMRQRSALARQPAASSSP